MGEHETVQDIKMCPKPSRGKRTKNSVIGEGESENYCRYSAYLPMKIVVLNVELPQVLHVSERSRYSTGQPVSPKTQPLQALTMRHHSLGNSSFQVIVVQIQVLKLRKVFDATVG